MSDVQLVNVARGDALVPDGYYRLVFARGSLAPDEIFMRELQRVTAELPARRVAIPLLPAAAAPSDRAAVLDVKISRNVGSATVADLLAGVARIVDIPGIDVLTLRRLERVSAKDATGMAVARARDVVLSQYERDHPASPAPLAVLWHKLQSLGSVAYYAVALLIVGAVLVVLYQLNRKARDV